MSAPALIRQDDAKRLFAAASEMGYDRCEVIVGDCKMIFTKDRPSEEPIETEAYLD